MANAAEMESYKEADIDKYQFLATLDMRTSKVSQKLDLQIFNVKDARPGKNMPPMHPHCRATTIVYFDDDTTADIGRRARDPETGKNRGTLLQSVEEKICDTSQKSATIMVEAVNKTNGIFDGGKYKVLTSAGRFEKLANSQKVSAADAEILWDKETGYIQSPNGYKAINQYLRGQTNDLPDANKKTLEVLTKVTEENNLPGNYIGIRKIDGTYLDDVLGVRTSGKEDLTPWKWLDEKNTQEAVDKINALIGRKIKDDAFTSISMVEDRNYKDLHTEN